MTPTSGDGSLRRRLSVANHDRDVAGLTYVYPVLSRRSGGVSIGINLNPNNACNFRCVYCQVPDLSRGSGPAIDLERLRTELKQLLDALDRDEERGSVPLKDFAFSGNGEPTSSPDFCAALEIVRQVRDERVALRGLPIVLITNGSLVDRKEVQRGLELLASLGGVVWFKVDAGTDEGLRRTNSVTTRLDRHLERLSISARLCPTWVQSCWFRRNDREPELSEVDGFVEALRRLLGRGVPLRGVHLYTLARPSLQPEAKELGPVGADWLTSLGARLHAIGLETTEAT
ncbi:MAG: radical SAM protein [Polyangiaceae bacterium]